MFILKMYLIPILLNLTLALQKAKDNGDIYIKTDEEFLEEHKTENPMSDEKDSGTFKRSPIIDLNESVYTACNSSFSIPMDYLIKFNNTGELPDIVDKTGMCYVRCIFERSGLIENWKLNATNLMKVMGPAVSGIIPDCEEKEAKEKNACVRLYGIAKCLMTRCQDGGDS